MLLPLTIELTKPRLCYDARHLNLWMKDKPFSLDGVADLPRYVFRDSYQTVVDDKSGYDDMLLTEDSRTFFGCGVAAISFIIPSHLGGKCHPMCTTALL